MSSQIYNSDKYNFSKISLSGGRIPYYTDLSEIKTDSSFSSPRTLYLILRLSWKLITRFIFLHVIYIFLFKKKKKFNFGKFLWDTLYAKEPEASSWCLSGDVSQARPTHCPSLDIPSAYAELWPDQREGGFVSVVLSQGSSAVLQHS